MKLALIAVAILGLGCADSTQRSATTNGPELLPATVEQLRTEVARPGARAVVLNVWATWCAPCREEFPELLRLEQAYREQGLRLVLVSADFEDQAKEAKRFLASHRVAFPSYLKTGDDMAFIEGLHPGWTGALPATFVFDGGGALRHFREGRIRYEQLEARVLEAFHATDSLTKETLP